MAVVIWSLRDESQAAWRDHGPMNMPNFGTNVVIANVHLQIRVDHRPMKFIINQTKLRTSQLNYILMNLNSYAG